ncbi:MAG TPA: hypothetical protein PKC24_12125 [Cyclobacteriaceae bacterium]|nr:hypothetical protein [Cyclobacteriaceae bacterium]
MKGFTLIFALISLISIQSCQENTDNMQFTGREHTYALLSGSVYQVSGTVTFKEKTDKSTLVIVNLEGTEGTAEHPVHLHMGSIDMADAEIAALLLPVKGQTGLSETLLRELGNGHAITYEELLLVEANIKIHLADVGPERDIILAGGNIGAAFEKEVSKGRRGAIEVCKSE